MNTLTVRMCMSFIYEIIVIYVINKILITYYVNCFVILYASQKNNVKCIQYVFSMMTKDSLSIHLMDTSVNTGTLISVCQTSEPMQLSGSQSGQETPVYLHWSSHSFKNILYARCHYTQPQSDPNCRLFAQPCSYHDWLNYYQILFK